MIKYIIGIDPGPSESGYTVIDTNYNVLSSAKLYNDTMFDILQGIKKRYDCNDFNIVIESIQSYGMTMGKSTIETCYTIGRIIQICIDNSIVYKLYPRPEYGKVICGSNKVNDSLIRSALENRFGSYDKGREEKRLKNGTIKQTSVQEGPLYKLTGESDKRSAFAVAVYHLDKLKLENA